MNVIEINGVRYYETDRGLAPSVNAVIKSTQNAVEKAAIALAGERTGVSREEHFYRGNTVEAAIDEILDGQGGNAGEFEPYLVEFRPWVKKHLDLSAGFTRQQPIVGEMLGLPYAGTYDYLGWLKTGQQILIDWKAPRTRRSRSSPQCQGYLMQAAAYLHALKLTDTAIAQVVYLLPGKKPHVMKMSSADVRDALATFEDRLVWFHATQTQEAA